MGKKNKFEKIGRNETYYEAYGEEEVKEKKTGKSILGVDKENVPEKKKLSSRFTYIREKKQPEPTPETQEALIYEEIEKPRISPYVLTLVVVCLAFILKSLAAHELFSGFIHKNSALVSVAIYAFVYLIPSVIFVILSFGRMRFHYVRKFSPSLLPFSFACLGLVLSITALQKYLIAYTFGYSEPTAMTYGGVLTGVLLGALLPAVCEELLIHGILQKEISEYAGGFAGIIISAVVFSVLHFELQYFFVYLIAAVIMGALTHVTGSCLPAMLVHFLNNAFSILFSERLGFVATERIGGTLLIIVIFAVCLAFLILCLNIAEKISEKKADVCAENIESGEDVHIEYFFAREGRSLARAINVLKTPPMLICYVIFIIAVVLNMF